MKKNQLIPLAFIAFFFGPQSLHAEISPASIYTAQPKKTSAYFREGLLLGGDKEIKYFEIKKIRRALNAGFERVVIDLNAPTTPYFQVALEKEQNRIFFTVFGNAQLTFDVEKMVRSFRASPLVSKVEFYPQIDDGVWSFALYFKKTTPVEIFELTSPTRIVLDLKL